MYVYENSCTSKCMYVVSNGNCPSSSWLNISGMCYYNMGSMDLFNAISLCGCSSTSLPCVLGGTLPFFNTTQQADAVANAFASPFWIAGMSFGSVNENGAVQPTNIVALTTYTSGYPAWPPSPPTTRCIALRASISVTTVTLTSLSWSAPPINNGNTTLSCLQHAVAVCFGFVAYGTTCVAGWYYYSTTGYCYALYFDTTFQQALEQCYIYCPGPVTTCIIPPDGNTQQIIARLLPYYQSRYAQRHVQG